jgi:trigger factor
VNVSVEHLGACKKLLHVEIEAAAIVGEMETTSREFQRHVSLPGFRPGKAPVALVAKTLGPRIQAEARRKLIQEAYRKALEENNLRPVAAPNLEEAPWEPGQPIAFTATVETEPDFDIPDYRGIPIRRDTRSVTDDEVERALHALQEQKAVYVDLARPVQPGDFVVVNYTGTIDERPISDLVPVAQSLTRQAGFWLHVAPQSFIPGFTEQLVGAAAGEKRTLQVTFPTDFVTRELVGKAAVYQVEVVQIKERHLPPLDDAFAQGFKAADIATLRAGVRHDLEAELKAKQKREVRNQLVAVLLGRVGFELPECLVQHETRSAVYDIVRANQERGIPKAAIDEHKDEIYSVANTSARDRVKASIILARIAEKENITVTKEELTGRILSMAAHYGIKPDKLIKQLQEKGALGQIQQQILESKVLDAIELYAQSEESPLPT